MAALSGIGDGEMDSDAGVRRLADELMSLSEIPTVKVPTRTMSSISIE